MKNILFIIALLASPSWLLADDIDYSAFPTQMEHFSPDNIVIRDEMSIPGSAMGQSHAGVANFGTVQAQAGAEVNIPANGQLHAQRLILEPGTSMHLKSDSIVYAQFHAIAGEITCDGRRMNTQAISDNHGIEVYCMNGMASIEPMAE